MTLVQCLKCKKQTDTKNAELVKTKNNRTMIKGVCSECGTKKCKFVSADFKMDGGKLMKPKPGQKPSKMPLNVAMVA